MSNIHELYSEYTSKLDDETKPEDAALLKAEFYEKLKDADLNSTDPNNRTLLHKAVMLEDVDLVRYLLKRNVNAKSKDKHDRSPMIYALVSQNEIIIRDLVNAGCDVDEPDMLGNTHLLWAIFAGDIAKIELLLSLGANVHAITAPPEKKSILAHTCDTTLIDHTKKSYILKLLFQYGVGIGLNFDSVSLPPDIIDRMVTVGSQKNGKYNHDKTPGFETSICSVDKFLALAASKNASENVFNFKGLAVTTARVLSKEDNISDEKIREELKKLLVELRQRALGASSLKELYSFYIAKNFTLFQKNPNISNLPPDALAVIAKQSEEIQQILENKKKT